MLSPRRHVSRQQAAWFLSRRVADPVVVAYRRKLPFLPLSRLRQLEDCLGGLRRAGLLDSVQFFSVFGRGFNQGSGTVAYALVGPDGTLASGVSWSASGLVFSGSASAYVSYGTFTPAFGLRCCLLGGVASTLPATAYFISCASDADHPGVDLAFDQSYQSICGTTVGPNGMGTGAANGLFNGTPHVVGAAFDGNTRVGAWLDRNVPSFSTLLENNRASCSPLVLGAGSVILTYPFTGTINFVLGINDTVGDNAVLFADLLAILRATVACDFLTW
jgi:hypothetical protein